MVNSIRSIKYMYKYTYKGHDRAGVDVQDAAVDEIVQYLDARYVGPCEAVWRILEFPMHGRSHAVLRMPVHLKGKKHDKKRLEYIRRQELEVMGSLRTRCATAACFF